MTALPTSVTRITSLAVGILMLGAFAAEAAQNQGPTGERAQCAREAKHAYDVQIIFGCGSQEYLDQYGPLGGQPVCIADAAQFLHDQLDLCRNKPERQAINTGVRGAPPSLTDSGSGADATGGNGSGTGGPGGTYNPSMGSASMDPGGGATIIY
jgi:hypothetical protein